MSTFLNAVSIFCKAIIVVTCLMTFNVEADEAFVNVVQNVEEGVGAVAILTPIEGPNPKILGTGFLIADGSWVLTNYHVVDQLLNPQFVQHFVFLSGNGQVVKQVKAEISGVDPLHDIALLKLEKALPGALSLADEGLRKSGTDIAITGYPIGAVLGLYPATHRGIIAAITPDVIPVNNSGQLSLKLLQRLGNKQLIYQLDAIAYPGNSGSPLYLPKTGEVIGMVNKVLVKDTKESALSSPTGISYAIPLMYINKLIQKHI